MAELLYPIDPPQLYGPSADADLLLPIVKPDGEVVGRASREYVHSGVERLLHPSVHVHVIDRFSRLYLQLRGRTQEAHPGKWDVAVGGHVYYGELCEEALYREAKEELGLYDFNPVFVGDYIYESEFQSEFVCVYAAVGSFDLHPDTYEVQEGRYWTAEQIREKLGKGIFTPLFEREFDEFYPKLEALL